MEEINIEFTPEISEDIKNQQISKIVIDYIYSFENNLITISQLEELKESFIADNFFHYAEAVRRTIEAVKIIFE